MSVAARLAGFAAGLTAVFALALVAGGAIGSFDGDKSRPAAAGEAMGGMAAGHGTEKKAGAEPAHGLGVAENGLRLVAPTRARVGANDFAFRVVDERGRTLRSFDVEHTKRLHFIVVRRDMTGFQHLHPTMDRDGVWHARVRLKDAGAYRVYADFTPHGGEKATLASDLLVPGRFAPATLGGVTDRTTVDGYDVALRHDGDRLTFSVTRDGRPVAVEPYLGADGHLVALRDGDLAYLHVHPLTAHPPGGSSGRIAFMAEYPSAGTYRLFLQFLDGGTVHTAAFTQEIA